MGGFTIMPILYGSLLLVFGFIIGSFLNVVIYRLPKHESIVYGPSHCMNCNEKIKPYDLIPVLSYIILGGKCRSCSMKISIRYPLIELLNGLLYLGIFILNELTLDSILMMAFSSTLLVIAMIDFDTMDVYDGTLIVILLLGVVRLISDFSNFPSAILGGLVVSIPLYIIAILTQGIGGGDVKLMGVAGFFLGVKMTLVGTFLGILMGGLWGVILMVFFKKAGKAMIPFGPFLCIGMYIALLYGTQLADWYLGLIFG
ncbi:MAG TPA: prepilin peptidase [Erysipelotrichaceae bacterium]|nr:prepilin peptidase [Erysipelotrichaceae bacterium]